jgi:hypothetical protein
MLAAERARTGAGPAAAAAAPPPTAPRLYRRAPRAAAAMRDAAGAAAAQQAAPQQQLPATYRRLVASRTGGSFREVARAVEAPLPAPGPGEVLVRMRYAGINGGCVGGWGGAGLGGLQRRGAAARPLPLRASHPSPRQPSSCETFRARGEFAFAGNRERRDFPLGAEGAGEVVALGEGVASLQVGGRAGGPPAARGRGAAAFPGRQRPGAPSLTTHY